MRKNIALLLMIVVIITIASGSTKKPTKASNQAKAGIQTFVTGALTDYADFLSISGNLYGNFSDEAITDKKMLEKEIGRVKFELSVNNVLTINTAKETYATFLTVGTKIYSIENIDKREREK
jgi:hypothetical protein